MIRQLLSRPVISDDLPLLLRAYAVSAKSGKKKYRHTLERSMQSASNWSLVFDTETTTDAGQHLRIGFCRIYYRDELRRHVLFYDENLNANDLKVSKQYATEASIELMTRTEFIDKIFYKYGYHLRAMIVGFNLPFDLSRISIGHARARGSMRGGFTLKLSQLKYLPDIRIRHLSKHVSQILFAGYESPTNRSQRNRGRAVPYKRGYFLEVSALAAALLSRSGTLASLAQFLGVEHEKHESDDHGKSLTKKYLEYADRDVLTTWECCCKLRHRYASLKLDSTPVHRIVSEASIGKAYFTEMGIQPWLKVQDSIPPKLPAQILSAYFGGRSEVRIRRELRQVILCDFLSMYPTVCTLTGLWPFVIGKGMTWRDGTKGIIRILKSWSLKDLQTKPNWLNLVALVQVRPDADIFPLRAEYREGADGTIGANFLSSKIGLWFTLADCIAAQLLTGKPVKVLQAIIFKPSAPQQDLKPVAINGNSEYLVNPYEDDFYKRMIELRQMVKGKRDQSILEDYARFDVEQNALKIAANATSYGIFAEINVNDRATNEGTRIYGAANPSFILGTKKDERPGRYFHPLLAATITGAARLMLAIAEKPILDEGLEWAFCDTDSMAIAKPPSMTELEFYKRVDRIVDWFAQLNPYNFSGSILKIENVNYSLKNPKQRLPLFVWAVSAKRYALFNIENGQPVLRKASAHGLGQHHAPYGEKNPAKGIPAPKVPLSQLGVAHWHHDLWWLIAKAAISNHSGDVKFDHHAALKMPAARRYAATTPDYLAWFGNYNDGLPYARQVKPFGFVLAFSAKTFISAVSVKPGKRYLRSGTEIKPVAPFHKSPMLGARVAFDRFSRAPISVDHLKTYSEALAQYHLHPEDKFLNGDFKDSGTTLRRHVRVTAIEYIGKESNKWEDKNAFGFYPEDEIRYGSKPLSPISLFEVIQEIVEGHGLRETALKFAISRATLSKLLKSKFSECSMQKLQRYSRVASDINSEEDQKLEQHSQILEMARNESQRLGFSAFAKTIEFDQSNLQKILSGDRKLNTNLMNALNLYFDQFFGALRENTKSTNAKRYQKTS